MIVRSSRPFRLAAWLALAAMLSLALAPSISHALAASRGDAAFAEVCTSSGIRFVATSASPGAVAPGSPGAPGDAIPNGDGGIVAMLDHLGPCPLCALGPIGGLTGPSARVACPADPGPCARLAPREAPRPGRIALAAPPRGPPAQRA
jgi:hypothetical protein